MLGGGEDHALVATFPGTAARGWRVIGRVLDGPPRVLVDGDTWHGNRGLAVVLTRARPLG